MDNNLKISFNAKLNEEDTENQTYGCRANNPEICSNCFLTDICAFVRKDKICKKPSRAWKKQFQNLKKEKNNGEDRGIN